MSFAVGSTRGAMGSLERSFGGLSLRDRVPTARPFVAQARPRPLRCTISCRSMESGGDLSPGSGTWPCMRGCASLAPARPCPGPCQRKSARPGSHSAGVGIFGTKAGMTGLYRDGRFVPATIIAVEPGNIVTQLKTEAKHGYNAVQVGYRVVPDRKVTKPERNHLAKAGAPAMKFLREFRVRAGPGLEGGEGRDAAGLVEDLRRGAQDPAPSHTSFLGSWAGTAGEGRCGLRAGAGAGPGLHVQSRGHRGRGWKEHRQGFPRWGWQRKGERGDLLGDGVFAFFEDGDGGGVRLVPRPGQAPGGEAPTGRPAPTSSPVPPRPGARSSAWGMSVRQRCPLQA